MVQIGSQNKVKLTRTLATALNTYTSAESSKLRKAYANALKVATKMLSESLLNKDIPALFELEKSAQEFDFDRSLDAEKSRGTLTSLDTLKTFWENGQNPSYVQNRFANAHDGIKKAITPVKDTAMDSLIQSQCRKLGALAGNLTTPAEKAFYLKRQECLKFIGKQHNLTINQHLGLGKGKELGR